MAILLDTQILIWLEESPDKIPTDTREFILSESVVHISPASVWEMAIKRKIGKLRADNSLPSLIENFQVDYNFQILSIQLSHIYKTEQLPLHHRDPFDRLLIAQSIIENIGIVSSDEIFDAYEVNRIW